MITTEWLTPLEGHETVYLPLDIPPHETRQCAGEIWARIKSLRQPPDTNSEFDEETTIQLEAIIPDILWKVYNFNRMEKVRLRYPFSLRWDPSQWLDAMPSGHAFDMQWGVSTD